ncbi:MAG: hypothetical protein IPL46_25345 [Saprospiraceae bacterium]|nr:hypothetical protein [Saprospiraceae bacterium]
MGEPKKIKAAFFALYLFLLGLSALSSPGVYVTHISQIALVKP